MTVSSVTSRVARGANCSTSAAVSERAARLRARKGSRITGRTKTWQTVVNLKAGKQLYNVIEESDIRVLFFLDDFPPRVSSVTAL